jgi:DnaJ-domain-containing protein 1
LADSIQGLGLKSEKPQLNPSADLAATRLTPTEAFVLSRVDGKTSYEEICSMTGLGVEPTIRILQKLRRDRLLLHAGEKPEPKKPDKADRAAEKADRLDREAVMARQRPATGHTQSMAVPAFDRNRSSSRPALQPAPPSLLEVHDDGSAVDPGDLLVGPALDVETKARILRLHRRLKALKPHELLGVPHGADLAQVKRAYFAASKEIHPDRFYGKDIGPFREFLSDIFAHLTGAFDQLKRNEP